nr:MAG TPA: hypothetical protein [Caudoviricetes sp.]
MFNKKLNNIPQLYDVFEIYDTQLYNFQTLK